MSYYRNIGAPHHRSDGSIVPPGSVFEPSPLEIRQLEYKLVYVGDTPDPKDHVVGPVVPPPPPLPKEWPITMRPELYIKLHPTGRHADLAKRLLGIEEPQAYEGPENWHDSSR